MARSELRPNEIQDLADIIPALVADAAGYGLKFSIEIQLGEGKAPAPEVVDKLNEKFASVNKKLRLE